MAHGTNGEIDSLMTAREKSFPLSSSVVIGTFVLLDGSLFISSGILAYMFLIGGLVPLSTLYLTAIFTIWLVLLFLFQYCGLYRFEVIMAPTTNIFRLAFACVAAFILLLAVAFSLKFTLNYSRIWLFS
jgi:hypothetical protein